jgi:hypothetical protein
MAHELYFGLTIEFQRQCHADLAPHLFAIIPKKRIQRCTVQEGLTNHLWVSGLQGPLSVVVLID